MGLILPVRDSRLIIIPKTVTEVVNNSAVLQDDDELFKVLPADSNYFWWLYIMGLSSAAADFRFNMVAPAGTTNTTYMDSAGNSRTYGTNYFPAGAAAEMNYWLCGHLHIVGGGGTFKFQWAQQTAEVSNTTIYAGSLMYLLRTA